jgi:hypothetical protein
MDTDLRNTKGRLQRLALAAVIGAIMTFFMMKAMLSSGPRNHDPVGASIAPLLAIFVFVVTTGFSHAILSRRRR